MHKSPVIGKILISITKIWPFNLKVKKPFELSIDGEIDIQI